MTLNISDPNNYLDKEIESKLDHIVNYVLENESQSKSEINLMICCEQEMTKLNKNFRNIGFIIALNKCFSLQLSHKEI